MPRLPTPRPSRKPEAFTLPPTNGSRPAADPLAPIETNALDALQPARPSMLAPPSVAIRTSIAPKPPASRNNVVIAICALLLLPALVFAAVLAWRLGTQPTRTVVVAAASPSPTTATTAPPVVRETAPAPRVATPPPSNATRSRRSTGSRPASANASATSAREDRAPTTAAAAPAADPDAARAACARACHGNVDCVLRCTVGNSRRAPVEDDDEGDEDLPATPPRGEVQSALQSASSEVSRCANGRSGNAAVDVTFASSGRVTTALVSPPFSGTPEGSCMARALRTMRVPAFSQASFHVTHSFRITGAN
jgi:hypothetical protein